MKLLVIISSSRSCIEHAYMHYTRLLYVLTWIWFRTFTISALQWTFLNKQYILASHWEV